MIENFKEVSDLLSAKIKEKKPLIHCITNYVTINDCANIILAIGARPVMTDDPIEAGEVTEKADALLLNLGGLNEKKAEAMQRSAKIAKERGIPIVLDPVGVGNSAFRRETARRIIEDTTPDIIRGNISEILCLANAGLTEGVDSLIRNPSQNDISEIKKLAGNLNCVVCATGEVDVITDGILTHNIKIGHPMMSGITGTGCMCSCLTACAAVLEKPFTAASFAAVLWGKAGEAAHEFISENNVGLGMFKVKLFDFIGDMAILKDFINKSTNASNKRIIFGKPLASYLRLYLVTGSEFLPKLESALQGGVTMIQLREKDISTREYLSMALEFKKITDKYNVPLIINDRVDIAQAADAAGVHLGDSDMPPHSARRILGENKIIGITAKTVESACAAEQNGADYLGVGAIFPSTTKITAIRMDIAVLKEIKKSVNIPIVAIGGLTPENIKILKHTGISGIAVSSYITSSDNPKRAARTFELDEFI